MAGTMFHRSHTPLQKWFYALYLFTTSRHGVPAKELQRQLGVSYPTALRMAHEIRKYMGEVDGEPPLTGHVEVDETYVGGKRPGKRWPERIALWSSCSMPYASGEALVNPCSVPVPDWLLAVLQSR